jgi:hypothetical protein
VTLVGTRGYGTATTTAGSIVSGGRYFYYQATRSTAGVDRLGGTLMIASDASRQITGALRWSVAAGTTPRISTAVDQDYDVTGAPYAGTNAATNLFSPVAASAPAAGPTMP